MLVNIGDVVDGALVEAIALVGRRISVTVDGLRGRGRATDVSVARWFETYQLTSAAPDLPELSPAVTDCLTEILGRDEAQAALQELLAARLTDASEADAGAARQVLVLTLSTARADVTVAAQALADYYDDQVCALVARLEAGDPPLLAQIRSDAFSTRMISILNAIERHTAALSARPAQRTETGFLTSYRRHVVDQHGRLEPPDFDRRRRVPIADIYVPTVVTEHLPELASVTPPAADSPFTVYDLADWLDRSVLLGDPGGGKTTAANVLMHHFARNSDGRVPFLLTLRDYAAADPPARSVTGHIEHTLETFYQCPAPPGLVDLLLLTGRGIVIFDGLDELLDTSRRADVTTRIERFCAEYPLATVLVTSRLVGYDQAQLDDNQFTCYRLGGFDDEKVAEYVCRWFTQDREAGPGDAKVFLAESASVPDLRSNPLLLSLMCILYRGAGSLPRDRAGVYEQCADLLFRRWDARRRIHQELRAGHLLEPALRHLAWWLYTRNDTQPVVTERELIDATTEFLHGRGFEAADDARAAAREFIEFCRGRMWVFSDSGTTGTGERLYGFTHRTFLEYFAAAQLAYASDSPEQLAEALISRVSSGESLVVPELAMQIKDRTSSSGAPRIYHFIMDNLPSTPPEILGFLALALRSVDPSPRYTRELARRLCEITFDHEMAGSTRIGKTELTGVAFSRDFPVAIAGAWHHLAQNCGAYRGAVSEEIDLAVSEKIDSGDQRSMVGGLRLALSLSYVLTGDNESIGFWRSRSHLSMMAHSDVVVACAHTDAFIRIEALQNNLITTRQALDMPGGPSVLFRQAESCFARHVAFFADAMWALHQGWPAIGQPNVSSQFAAFGEYLTSHRLPPWLYGALGRWDYGTSGRQFTESSTHPSRTAYLGIAVILMIMIEVENKPALFVQELGPLADLAPYIEYRWGREAALPDLPVPGDFQQVFRDWAEGRVNFVSNNNPGSF